MGKPDGWLYSSPPASDRWVRLGPPRFVRFAPSGLGFDAELRRSNLFPIWSIAGTSTVSRRPSWISCTYLRPILSAHMLSAWGTAQELKDSAAPWSAIASSGLWRSPAFRGYVDMSRGVEMGGANSFSMSMPTPILTRRRYTAGFISGGTPWPACHGRVAMGFGVSCFPPGGRNFGCAF